jgi:hypothetical protein
MPAQEDLDLYSGDDYTHKFTWTDDGVAVNLTGAVITAQIRRHPDSTSILASFAGDITEDPSHGVFKIGLNGTTVATLPKGRGAAVYDVQFVLAGGRKVTAVAGKVNVDMDVTR